MPLPKPIPGLVLHYSYLWHSQSRSGVTEGTKNRPCVVVAVVVEPAVGCVVSVVPITHSPPENVDAAVALPMPTKRRMGLDDGHAWIVVREINRFHWPGYDLRSIPGRPDWDCAYCILPPKFFEQIKTRLLESARAQRLSVSQR